MRAGARTALLETIATQRLGCELAGSPLYAAILDAVAEDVGRDGPVGRLLEAVADAPFGDAVLLRLLGGLHRLVLEGEAHVVDDPAVVARLAQVWADGGWPCTVDESGTALTAEFSAPSAGSPPWKVYRITPAAATVLQTVEPGGATRFTF